MTEWRDMEMLPSKTAKFMFWLDWSDGCAPLNPKIAEFDYDTRLFIGKYKCWSSNYKAVKWALLPIPPRPALSQSKD